jgi:hypothetical protein
MVGQKAQTCKVYTAQRVACSSACYWGLTRVGLLHRRGATMAASAHGLVCMPRPSQLCRRHLHWTNTTQVSSSSTGVSSNSPTAAAMAAAAAAPPFQRVLAHTAQQNCAKLLRHTCAHAKPELQAVDMHYANWETSPAAYKPLLLPTQHYCCHPHNCVTPHRCHVSPAVPEPRPSPWGGRP